MRQDNGPTIAAVIFVLLVVVGVVGAIWVEISLWRECRQTNSFFYCLRVLNK